MSIIFYWFHRLCITYNMLYDSSRVREGRGIIINFLCISRVRHRRRDYHEWEILLKIQYLRFTRFSVSSPHVLHSTNNLPSVDFIAPPPPFPFLFPTQTYVSHVFDELSGRFVFIFFFWPTMCNWHSGPVRINVKGVFNRNHRTTVMYYCTGFWFQWR